jgi:serine/threonine-protein kinase
MIGEGYEIDRFLSKSSLGEVYLAFNEETQQLVQIKVLPRHLGADPERRERFKREMRFAASLKHPGILGVIGAGEESGRLFLVSEYQEGMSLADHIGRYGILEEKDALEFAAQIADALAHAWEDRKVVHRDIRPANIQITAEPRTAKILDFGIAKSLEQDVDANLTGAGFTVGTPEYMSPEQVRGEDNIDFRSDMYSLGLLIYESLSGRKAFEDKSVMVVMTRQMKEPPKPLRDLNPKVSKACADLVDRLLAKSRDQRFSSWSELCQALRRTAAGEVAPPSAQAIKAEVKAEAKSEGSQTLQAFNPAQQNHGHKLKESEAASAAGSKAPLWVLAGVTALALIIVVLVVVFK